MDLQYAHHENTLKNIPIIIWVVLPHGDLATYEPIPNVNKFFLIANIETQSVSKWQFYNPWWSLKHFSLIVDSIYKINNDGRMIGLIVHLYKH